jgi:hypothetical protein
MEPLAHGAIRFRHFGDLREHGALLVRLGAAARGRLQLLGAVLHRGSFLVRESLALAVDRGGAVGGVLVVLHCRFPRLRVSMLTSVPGLHLSLGRCDPDAVAADTAQGAQ